MGNASWSAADWNTHASDVRGKSRAQVFATSVKPEQQPHNFKHREARDSEVNPEATPIILASDVTGSMGELAERLVKHDLGVIMKELYDRKPVTNPAILCMAIGDANSDQAPIQTTQFESSIVLAEQLKDFWIEGNGGGNGGESYALAWAFAAYKTKVDSLKKRGKKGYVFTIGDECAHRMIARDHSKKFLGLDAERDIDVKALIADAQKDWNLFHLIVKPVHDQPVVASWKELLGERAIVVKDIEKLAAGIVSVIQLIEGHDAGTVADGWSAEEALVVRDVTAQLVASGA